MSTTTKKCNYPKCANHGTFEGDQCPGSDNEDDDLANHHCVDCGELWWVNKGLSCDLCGDYWCPLGWQNTFVFLESCDNAPWDKKQTGYLEAICSKCFLNDQQFWCPNPDNCNCDQNHQEVQDNWQSWLNRQTS